ncbi:DUF4097 family beta strand repeat-containing protein [Streptomyces sp. NPDC059092]|uniref:DUF4097 family beta strand repeat-containing protein n=1 Tax=Streptomyces sp. NPDC059092 TaxID=3346725 RepID=UPI003698083C
MAPPNRIFRTSILAGGALLALVAVTGCGESTGDDNTPEKRSFGPVGDQLTISRSNGDLTVKPADVDEVEVTRWFSGWSAVGDKPKASWKLTGDALSLTTSCGSVISNCGARYEVLVPRRTALTIDGDNGRTTASGFTTDLDISSDNGAVTVSDSSGALTVRSGSGEVRATGLKSRRVEAGSDNGKVYLAFTAVPDQVGVKTDNGGVTVEVPDGTYKVTTKTDNGKVQVDVPNDAGSAHTITATTDNGGITVRTAR